MRAMIVLVVALLASCGRSGSATPAPVERPASPVASAPEEDCADGCEEPARATGPRWVDDLPVVQLPTAGTDEVASAGLALVLAADGIYLDGERVVEANDGLVDGEPAYSPLVAIQMRVGERLNAPRDDDQADPRLTSLEVPAVQLVLGAGARHDLLIRAARSSLEAGAVMIELVGMGEGGARSLRLWLPSDALLDGDVPILAIGERLLVLFSSKGALGTLPAPALRTETVTAADLARVQAAVLAARPRLHPRTAVLMADASLSAQTVVDAIAALRVAPDGSELLPDVILSAGFR